MSDSTVATIPSPVPNADLPDSATSQDNAIANAAFTPPSPNAKVCYICKLPPKRPTDSYRITSPEEVQFCFALPILPPSTGRICARHYHLLRLHSQDKSKVFPFEHCRPQNDRKRIACTVVSTNPESGLIFAPPPFAPPLSTSPVSVSSMPGPLTLKKKQQQQLDYNNHQHEHSTRTKHHAQVAAAQQQQHQQLHQPLHYGDYESQLSALSQQQLSQLLSSQSMLSSPNLNTNVSTNSQGYDLNPFAHLSQMQMQPDDMQMSYLSSPTGLSYLMNNATHNIMNNAHLGNITPTSYNMNMLAMLGMNMSHMGMMGQTTPTPMQQFLSQTPSSNVDLTNVFGGNSAENAKRRKTMSNPSTPLTDSNIYLGQSNQSLTNNQGLANMNLLNSQAQTQTLLSQIQSNAGTINNNASLLQPPIRTGLNNNNASANYLQTLNNNNTAANNSYLQVLNKASVKTTSPLGTISANTSPLTSQMMPTLSSSLSMNPPTGLVAQPLGLQNNNNLFARNTLLNLLYKHNQGVGTGMGLGGLQPNNNAFSTLLSSAANTISPLTHNNLPNMQSTNMNNGNVDLNTHPHPQANVISDGSAKMEPMTGKDEIIKPKQ